MARTTRYITRRVNSEQIKFIVFANDGVEEREITFPRSFKEDREREKAIIRTLPENERFIKVKEIAHKSGIYGISETDFMQHATFISEER